MSCRDFNSCCKGDRTSGNTMFSIFYCVRFFDFLYIPLRFISTRPILDLCLTTERRTGSRVDNRWWDREVLDLEGMCMADWEAEQE